jgi:hypothetical protein
MLSALDQLSLGGATVARVFGGERLQMSELAAPSALDLVSTAEKVNRVHVRFVTPTELKSGRQVAEHPEFGILFGRLRDRISTLRALYGDAPLEIDFRAMGKRAAAVRMTRCQMGQTQHQG